MRPYLERAAAFVVPIRIGGGTRLKIFEAMAMGKAVVSTTIGAEGLPVTPGGDVIVADDPASFAHAVLQLMRDVPARRTIEAAARRLVVERYDWSAVASDFEAAIARVTAGPDGRRQRDEGSEGAGGGALTPDAAERRAIA